MVPKCCPRLLWIAAVVGALLVVVGVAFVIWDRSSPSNRLQWLGLWSGFVILLLNLYRDSWTHLFWPAILDVQATMRTEDKALTPVYQKWSHPSGVTMNAIAGYSFYWQLTVKNHGPATARQVGVMVQRIERRADDDFSWEPYTAVPLNLKWAYREADPFYPYIPSGVSRTCTLGWVDKPPFSSSDVPRRDGAEEISLFRLSIEIRPNSLWHEFKPGKYRLHLVVSGDNTWTRRKTIEVKYHGGWNDDLSIVEVT